MASPLFEEISEQISAVIAGYHEAYSDGSLSFSEAFALVQKATASFVQVVQLLKPLASNEEKKAAVLEALGLFYDQVIAPMDIKGIPNLIEGVVDSSLKSLLLLLADSGIDAIVSVLKKFWNNEPDAAEKLVAGPIGDEGFCAANFVC